MMHLALLQLMMLLRWNTYYLMAKLIKLAEKRIQMESAVSVAALVVKGHTMNKF